VDIADFWRPSPAKAARDRELREALALLRRSLNPLSSRTSVVDQVLFAQARYALRRLATSHPRDADLWYWHGHAAHIARDERETLSAWLKVWALQPDHWSSPDTAFLLGIILAKEGRYAESVRIYERGMPRAVQLSTRGIMASNAAESAMATGDLAMAERLYRESLILRPRSNSAAWWGLMVALDRRGRTFAAEQAAREALMRDPGLDGLRGPDVFFVPPGDVHYYLALAHQAGGRARESLREWERFLERLPESPHAERAREHVRAVSAQVARFRPRAWLGRVIPPSASREVAALQPLVERCYLVRGRRPPLPEGELPLLLSIRAGRVRGVEASWAPRALRDPALSKCVAQALRGRPLAAQSSERVFVTFHLERAP
jgi:tetratricopeptide (TPR) repeat protein